MLRAFLDRFRPPALTPQRIRAAYAVAITVDVIQIALGPLGWFFADEIIDIIAAILVWRLIGFHPLLLPTFVLEVVPVIDMMPTWTGCVAIVVNIRKRQQAVTVQPPVASGRIIDI